MKFGSCPGAIFFNLLTMYIEAALQVLLVIVAPSLKLPFSPDNASYYSKDIWLGDQKTVDGNPYISAYG
tara:strand:+ start:620 stop:826 length:207 start_codon:yes stop_codon:yes gene_type:complete